jgi:hypothetical protein
MVEALRSQRRARLQALKRRIELGRYRPDAMLIALAILSDRRARDLLSILPPEIGGKGAP